ncbi:MAG: DUF1850 domain-containing protein [Thermodesulfobacteriota bacterium]
MLYPGNFRLLAGFLAISLMMAGTSTFLHAETDGMRLEILRQADAQVLWTHSVKAGDCFTLDYRHSSDHTPVRDLFQITRNATFVLIEEQFDWYGSGLEFHPSADITFSHDGTRVFLNRHFPFLLLRVGEIARQVLTVNGSQLPLLAVAEGRESVCIRIKREPANP